MNSIQLAKGSHNGFSSKETDMMKPVLQINDTAKKLQKTEWRRRAAKSNPLKN